VHAVHRADRFFAVLLAPGGGLVLFVPATEAGRRIGLMYRTCEYD
jgi:hypothetical protein